MNNLSLIRGIIVVMTIITAGVHFYLSPGAGVPFILNGLGYLALMGAVLVKVPFLAGRERMVHYAFLGFTAVTILGWLAIGDKSFSTGQLGYFTKVVELILMAAIWQHLKLTA